MATNKNEWVNNFANAIGESGGQSPNPTTGSATGGENPDKYKALETTSYKELLNTKIQASAVKEQAQKYVGNTLRASGMGTQGVAESTRAGIMGNYGRAIQEADETHQRNLLDINTQRENDLQAQGTDRWQSAMEMLQQAQSQDELDYVKNNFYDSFTEDQKKYFDYYYASYGNQMSESSVSLGSQYSYDKGTEVYAYDNKTGGSVSAKGKFNYENDTLNSALAKNELQRGSYIQLANDSGQSIYLYYDKNGQLFYVSKKDYEAVDVNKKYHIKGKDNKIYTGGYNS